MKKITDEFLSIIGGLLELYGQQASQVKVNIYWSTLGHYPINLLKAAANAWVRKSQFMPKPADLINLMGGESNHLSADEAWAIAMLAVDESNTIIWTYEMQKAWAIASVVYENGDKIGARRTFIDAYERIVNQSILAGKKPGVFVSIGTDKQKREEAINNAVFAGLLTQEKANHHLPKPEMNLSMLENKNANVSKNPQAHIETMKKMILGSTMHAQC